MRARGGRAAARAAAARAARRARTPSARPPRSDEARPRRATGSSSRRPGRRRRGRRRLATAWPAVRRRRTCPRSRTCGACGCDPRARGRGAGRALVEAVVGLAPARRGSGALELSRHRRARRPPSALYARLGFRRTGVRAAARDATRRSTAARDGARLIPPPLPIETERLRLRFYDAGRPRARCSRSSRARTSRAGSTWGPRDRGGGRASRWRKKHRRDRASRRTATPFTLAIESRRRAPTSATSRSGLTSAEHRQGEIGFILHPDHHGRGYATEAAARAARARLRRRFGMRRIIGSLEARNAASRARAREARDAPRGAPRRERAGQGRVAERVLRVLAAEWRGSEPVAAAEVGDHPAQQQRP